MNNYWRRKIRDAIIKFLTEAMWSTLKSSGLPPPVRGEHGATDCVVLWYCKVWMNWACAAAPLPRITARTTTSVIVWYVCCNPRAAGCRRAHNPNRLVGRRRHSVNKCLCTDNSQSVKLWEISAIEERPSSGLPPPPHGAHVWTVVAEPMSFALNISLDDPDWPICS